MKSYNCFHSAIFEVLEPYFHGNTKLLIHNRWQFFYHPGDYYSDDKRIVGEFPLPFDHKHLRMLFDIFQIKIEVLPVRTGIDGLITHLKENGFAIIFANKYILNGLYKMSKGKRCVTTIRIDGCQQEEFSYKTYDDYQTGAEINLPALEKAWKGASEYDFLNQSIVKISLNDSGGSQKSVKDFFWANFIQSIKNYLAGEERDGIISGWRGLVAFAESIVDWKREGAQKLIDCAMYIEFIIKQRELLSINLISIFPGTGLSESIDRIHSIIEAWKKVRMFFYIVGKREQYESLRFLSNQIQIIAGEEYLCLKELLEKTEKFYLGN